MAIIFGIMNMTAKGIPFRGGNQDSEMIHKENDEFSESGEILNFKHFEVNVNEAGSYYAEFWLLPSEYVEGSYTQFHVYVNGDKIGCISPDHGDWQSARVDGHYRIDLIKGRNIIAVGTKGPEIPSVEIVNVSATHSGAMISSEEYNEM